MDVKLHTMFAVPFATAMLAAGRRLNPELRALILDLEAQGDTYRNPGSLMAIPAGLFESDFAFFARGETCVRELRAACWHALATFIGAIAPEHQADQRSLNISSHTWFHVTRDGGWFGCHNHPMASWSGVYCVDDGQPDLSVPENSILVFPNPMTAANVFLDPTNASMRWPYAHGNYAQRLEPGQLVLFPSWLPHFVTPYRGAGERITVAFNCWFAASE